MTRFFCMALLVLLTICGPSHAQENDQVLKQKQAEDESLLKQKEQEMFQQSLDIVEDLVNRNATGDQLNKDVKFLKPTAENIMHLMWLFGVYDPDNVDDLTAAIMKTECNLYTKHYTNDFEWRKILGATSDYFKKYSNSYSNYFEIVQPLYLGRYDFDLKGFKLLNPYEFANVSAIQISINDEVRGPCSRGVVASPRYSTAAILNLKNPFNIDYIRVSEELAAEYLDYIKENSGSIENTKSAYLRYRVRVDKFLTQTKRKDLGNIQVFNGQILRLDIFADREMLRPLYSQTYD